MLTHTIESRVLPMTDSLDSGSFKIVSITQGNPPIGVSLGRPAWQTVHVNGRVHNV
jgi:hypothetical protein